VTVAKIITRIRGHARAAIAFFLKLGAHVTHNTIHALGEDGARSLVKSSTEFMKKNKDSVVEQCYNVL
jgi:hypothetical protein